MMCTSYREMIRNRITEITAVNLALKWCKAKERWIDHVYDNFINIYVEKQDRYEATRIVLGISSKNREFNFHETIHWENLDAYENEYWECIEGWVKWFKENYETLQQDIQNKIDIVQQYTISTGLAKYLITNLSLTYGFFPKLFKRAILAGNVSQKSHTVPARLYSIM